MGLFSEVLSPFENYFNTQDKLSAANATAQAQNKAMQPYYQQAGQDMSQANNAIQGMYNPYIQQGQQAGAQYQQMAQSGAPAATPFSYNKTTQDFMDPNVQWNIQQGTNALDASAAARGGLFSGGHGVGVQSFAQNNANQAFGNAQRAQQSDQSQAYKQYYDSLNLAQQARQQQMGQLQTIMNMGYNSTGQAANSVGSNASAQGNLALKQGTGNAQAAGAQAAYNQGSGWNMGDTLGVIGGLGDAGAQLYTGMPDFSGGAQSQGTPYQSGNSSFDQTNAGLDPSLYGQMNGGGYGGGNGLFGGGM